MPALEGWTYEDVLDNCGRIWGYVRDHYQSLDSDRHTQAIALLVWKAIEEERAKCKVLADQIKADRKTLQQRLQKARITQQMLDEERREHAILKSKFIKGVRMK